LFDGSQGQKVNLFGNWDLALFPFVGRDTSEELSFGKRRLEQSILKMFERDPFGREKA
jgi:hypothetical protein